MSDLRSLLYTGAAIVNAVQLQEIMIANTTESPSNGGACCCWEIPAGTSYINIEMWGGGGGGNGGCCCMQGRPGGSGSYLQKSITGDQVIPGTYICICAGGSTSASPTDGCAGCHSRAIGCNITTCARGGMRGYGCCNYYVNCYNCQLMCYGECCSFGGDVNIHSTTGDAISSQYCFNIGHQYAPVAPGTVSGPLVGPGGCTCTGYGAGANTQADPVFPGGAGFTAQHYSGGCFCGVYGAAGAVLIKFG